MKRLLLASFLIMIGVAVHAQETTLAPDQNPNYKISQDRYTKAQDQLLATMNTTVQQTYKAYDFYEAKLERKQQRYEDRRERRLYRLQYGNYYDSYYNGYNNPYRYSRYNRYRHSGWMFGW